MQHDFDLDGARGYSPDGEPKSGAYNPADYGLPVWRDEDHLPPKKETEAEAEPVTGFAGGMTAEEAQRKFCLWLEQQVGYREGANNQNKYADTTGLQQMYGWYPQNQPWCFTENTLILTQNGYKRVQDIEVGDSLMNAHGDRFNKVVKVSVRDANVRDYRAYGAIPFSVTSEHPFLSEKRNDKYHRKNGFKDWGFHPIEELRTGDMIAMPKTPVLYEDALSYDELWIVGYFVGDGYCSKGNEYVLCANEQKAKKISIHADGRWDKDYASRTCKQFNFSAFGKPILKETLDDCGNGAVNKRVPKRVLFGTLDAKRAFLDGYFSADGCETNHSFNSVSAELVTGIARLLADLDNPCSINLQKRPPQSKIWDARLNAYRVINQQEVIYNCTVCNTDDQQYQHFITKEKYVMIPLRKIGKERMDTVYTLTTDGDHTYTANNIGVHNCDVFYDAGMIECFGVDTACAMTYQPMGAGSALCKQSAQYYKDHGAFFKTPELGDQIFFYVNGEINHTGGVVGVAGGSVTTVEGNSSDMVAKRIYSVGDGKIAGYGRPNWAAASSTVVDTLVTVPAQSAEPSAPARRDFDLRFPYLQRGDIGAAVIGVQFQLIGQGYSVGPDGADGDYGRNTEEGVKEYQLNVHLEPDGIVGPETAARLFGGEVVTQAQTVQPAQETKKQKAEQLTEKETRNGLFELFKKLWKKEQ